MKRVLLLFALLGALTGCATTEARVPIAYTATPTTNVGHGQSIALRTTDGRTADRERISTKINGFGMEMAAIRSARPVPAVVQDALAKEFEAHGFRLASSGRHVSVAVDRFYNRFGVGILAGYANATVALTVKVAAGQGEVLFTHRFAGRAKERIMLASGSNAADTLGAALKDTIGKMFADPAFVHAVSGATNAQPTS